MYQPKILSYYNYKTYKKKLKNALCKRSTLLMKYHRCKLYITYALYT